MSVEATPNLGLEVTPEKYKSDEWRWSDAEILLHALPTYLRQVLRGRKGAPQIMIDYFESPSGSMLDHVLEGLNFAHELKRSDRAINQYYWEVTHNESESGKLLFEMMEDPKNSDHNKNHVRRVEEYVEWAVNHTSDIRHGSWEYRFWLPALYIATQFHDFPQLLSGKKESHEKLAALWVLANYKEMAKAMNIEPEHAWLLAKGAAVIIYHHGNPEEMEDTGARVTDISPKALWERIPEIDRQNLPQVFWIDYGAKIEEVVKIDEPLTQGLSDKHLLVLKRYVKLFGWADKADTAFGPMGVCRTFLAGISRDRPLYDKSGNDDVTRKIVELSRKYTTGGSRFVESSTRHNLIVAARDTKRIIVDLMYGNLNELNAVFDKRRQQLMQKMANRNRIGSKLIDNADWLMRRIKPSDCELLRRGLEAIDIEYQEVTDALGVGRENSKVREYFPEEIQNVSLRFERLISNLCADANVLEEDTRDWVEELPWTSYDGVARPEEMRRRPYNPR